MKTQALKNNLSTILWVITLITGATSFSVIGGIDTMRDVFAAPQKVVELQDVIAHQNEFIKWLEHYQENSWELFRLMTDDDDTLQWYFVDEQGISYDVDIRATAEDFPLAFVYKTHMVYRIHFSPADRKNFVNVPSPGTGDNEKYYLFKRD